MAGNYGALLNAGLMAALLLASPGSGAEMTFAADQPTQVPSADAATATRYQACVKSAAADHDSAWVAECKRLAEKDHKDYDDCLTKLNLPKSYCDASYTIHDGAPDCALPPARATVLDAELERARRRCLLESKSAAQ